MKFDFYFVIYLLFIMPCNYYLTRKLYRIYILHESSKSSVVLLSLVPMSKRHKEVIFISVAALAVFSLCLGHGVTFVVSFTIALIYQFIRKQTQYQKVHMTANKKLSLGHGAALWYYKNYLDRFIEKNLSSRIRQFMSCHEVKLPEKLYILCPHSCKVQTYIDDTVFIDRCRELPPLINNNSGIVKREYNITVYKIMHPSKTFRCAIEYAQPLKSLFRFKEMGRITALEMKMEREEFCKQLTRYLQEGISAQKLCELVEFDDETENLEDVLYYRDSIQTFLKENAVS